MVWSEFALAALKEFSLASVMFTAFQTASESSRELVAFLKTPPPMFATAFSVLIAFCSTRLKPTVWIVMSCFPPMERSVRRSVVWSQAATLGAFP